MRTTLAVVALAVLSLAGCARNRTDCTCCNACNPCSPPAPATYKPCIIASEPNPAPRPLKAEATSSPYTANVQAMPPATAPKAASDSKSAWPALGTPTPSPIGRPAPQAPPTPLPAPVVAEKPEPPAQTPAAELPEPTKLPERSSEPVPQRPKLPATPTDGPPEALNLGQTPEPEVAPIIQTSAKTEEPPLAEAPPAAQTSVEHHQTDSIKELTGVVETWRKTWRLRYAPIDVEDANGGRVMLIGGAKLGQLREGQRVRVHGMLIPTADRGSPPTFDVQSIEVVD